MNKVIKVQVNKEKFNGVCPAQMKFCQPRVCPHYFFNL